MLIKSKAKAWPKSYLKKYAPYEFLRNIEALRRKFPKSNLGWRERTALMAKNAKVTKMRGEKHIYRVTGGGERFDFTFNQPWEEDFKVVG